MFPQLTVHPSTESMHTDTLNSDPNLVFDGTCHKTKSQTNRHPSINRHICRVKPLPPSILLLSTCSLTPSIGGGRPEKEQGRVVGGGGAGGRKGEQVSRGGGLPFYFYSKGEEE